MAELEKIELTPEQLRILESVPEFEDFSKYESGPEPYTENSVTSIARRTLNGLTSGASEFGLQQGLDIPPPQNNPYFLGTVGEMVGTGAGFMLPAGLAAKGLAGVGMAAKTPRIAKLLETALASGVQEGAMAGFEGENPLPAAALGAAFGAVPEVPFRAWGYINNALASPNSNMLQRRILDPVNLKKQGILPEREKLAEILSNAGISAPGALRPRDWYVDLIESRASRSVAGRPLLQETADKVQRALDRFADDTLAMVGPDVQTGLHVDNAEMGRGLQKSFGGRIKSLSERAGALFDSVFKEDIGKTLVDPSELVEQLEGVIQHWDYDPKAALQVPGVAEIQAFIADLKQVAAREAAPILANPGSDLAVKLSNLPPPPEVLEPRTISWINARLAGLTVKDGKKWGRGDLIKMDAASTIREYVMGAVEGISPQHGEILRQARMGWRAHRELVRHPLSDVLLWNDTATVVNRLFRTPESIEQARSILPRETFKLARQRWLGNIIYRAKKGTEIEDNASVSGVNYVLNASGLNAAIKQMGGIDGETMRAAFVDAPEMLEALAKLQTTLQQAAPTLRRYKGEAETPGGPEVYGLGTLIRNLFTTITFPAHLTLTARAAKSVTSPEAINPFLGGIAPPSQLDKPFIRGLASAAIR